MLRRTWARWPQTFHRRLSTSNPRQENNYERQKGIADVVAVVAAAAVVAVVAAASISFAVAADVVTPIAAFSAGD